MWPSGRFVNSIWGSIISNSTSFVSVHVRSQNDRHSVAWAIVTRQLLTYLSKVRLITYTYVSNVIGPPPKISPTGEQIKRSNSRIPKGMTQKISDKFNQLHLHQLKHLRRLYTCWWRWVRELNFSHYILKVANCGNCHATSTMTLNAHDIITYPTQEWWSESFISAHLCNTCFLFIINLRIPLNCFLEKRR